ncbi:MAG: hypothetical protein ACYTJ0_15375, partial [Planctomycetota bacterium]
MADPDRLQQIFAAALGQPAEARAAFLDEACGGDAALRGEVNGLLAALDQAGDFMAAPSEHAGHAPVPFTSTETSDAAPVAEPPGTVMGRYKLL